MEGYHTLPCLYISYPISWIVTFVALLVCFLVVKHRLAKRVTVAAQAV